MLFMHSSGAYFVLLKNQFQWSGTVLSGAFALSRVESGILGPLQGWLIVKAGPRAVARLGILLFGLGFIFLSTVNSVTAFYLAFALMALGSGLGGFLTLVTTLVNWFEERRALAIGLATAGMGIGGLAVPIVAWSLTTFGWQHTAFGSGIVMLLIGLPLTQFYRRSPRENNHQSEAEIDSRTTGQPEIISTNSIAFTTRQALHTQAFWLISFGHASALTSVSTMTVHLVPHLVQELSFTVKEATIVIAVMNIVMIASQVVGGLLGDRFNKLVIAAACMGFHSSALLLLAHTTSGWAAYLAASLHGMAWGVRGPQMVAIRADFFGRASFGTIMGFSNVIIMLGMVSGPLLSGIIEDTLGSYKMAFNVLAIVTLIGGALFLLTRRPRVSDGRTI
jgi:MFS family permease